MSPRQLTDPPWPQDRGNRSGRRARARDRRRHLSDRQPPFRSATGGWRPMRRRPRRSPAIWISSCWRAGRRRRISCSATTRNMSSVTRPSTRRSTATSRRCAGRRIRPDSIDLAQKIELVRGGYRSYASHFAAVAETRLRLGLNENSGLEGALRSSVHAIEAKLNQLKEARLLVTMLMMRRHEKDFMLRRDAKYGEEMKKRAAEFVVALDATDVPPAAKNDIKRDLAAYQRDFFAWMNAALAFANEQKATLDAYGAIEPLVDDILASVKDAHAKAEAANQASRADTRLHMQIAILLTIIAVCAIAFWIGRSVSRPITSLTRAMGELARGRHDVDVQETERGDEIGEMARAVAGVPGRGGGEGRVSKAARTRNAGEVEEERRVNAEAQTEARRRAGRGRQGAGARASRRLSEGDLTFRLSDGFTDRLQADQGRLQRTIAQLQETIRCDRGSRPARSPAPPPRFRRARPTCRSAPRSRPRAWRRPRPRWKRSPRP